MPKGKYAVRFLALAERDLAEIAAFVAADSPSAATALIDRIERDLARLQRHPYLGRYPSDERLAALGYRALVIENYLVFYKVRGRIVLIHRILHGARDLPRLLEDE